MFNKNQITITILGVAGFILGMVILGSSLVNFKKENSIAVTGSAKKTITSDVAKWSATISRKSDLYNLKLANSALSEDIEVVLNNLKKLGFEKQGIDLSAVNISNDYTYKDGSSSQTGYTLSRDITLTSSDIAKMPKLSDLVGEMINQGVTMTNSRVEYYYSKLSELRVEMLGKATEDAKTRAEMIAKSSKASLGKLKSASMGVMQITAPNSTDLSGEGYYDTSSVEKEITAIVRTNFELR
jgi:hypothetical protein